VKNWSKIGSKLIKKYKWVKQLVNNWSIIGQICQKLVKNILLVKMFCSKFKTSGEDYDEEEEEEEDWWLLDQGDIVAPGKNCQKVTPHHTW
jgi:hypothetical protein